MMENDFHFAKVVSDGPGGEHVVELVGGPADGTMGTTPKLPEILHVPEFERGRIAGLVALRYLHTSLYKSDGWAAREYEGEIRKVNRYVYYGQSNKGEGVMPME